MPKTIHISPSAPRKPRASAARKPTYEQIQLRAYEIFLGRSGAPGDQLQDWLQAERDLAPRRKSPAKSEKTARPVKERAA